MATYKEIYDLRSNSDLRNKIAVAVLVKAQALLDLTTPTTKQVAWARDAISNPDGVAQPLLNYLLAKYDGLTVVQINGSPDSTIQTAVNSVVDAIIAGGI